MQSAPERRERILDILSVRNQVTYRELMEILQDEFTFSKRTLQRDIICLSASNAIIVKKGCRGGINLVQSKSKTIELTWSDEILTLLEEICDMLEDPAKILLLQAVMHPDEYFNNMHEDMRRNGNNEAQDMPPPLLMTMDEFRHYLGIGRTKAIQLLHEEGCPYAVMVGKRLYANRKKLDAWIEENTGNA